MNTLLNFFNQVLKRNGKTCTINSSPINSLKGIFKEIDDTSNILEATKMVRDLSMNLDLDKIGISKNINTSMNGLVKSIPSLTTTTTITKSNEPTINNNYRIENIEFSAA